MRQRLLLMALSLVAPAVVFMGLLTRAEYENSQARYEGQLIATTRALALATDRQIAQGQSTLQALAVSPALQTRDFAAFDRQARGALAGKSGWIVLINKDRQVLNTLLAPGAPLPGAGLPEPVWRELRAGRTAISNLAIGAASGAPIIAIDMPVLIGGELYDLAYVQNPRALLTIFDAQGLPPSWTGAIIDRNAALVARSRRHDDFVGHKASADMRAAMSRQAEGVVATHTLEGVPTLSAFSRSPGYGWTFIVGVPRAELRAQALRSVMLVALATGALLAIGLGVALLVARRISREVRSLMTDAHTITRGGAIAPRPRDLLETSQVRRALRHVSSELQQREQERTAASARQQVMINELNHRVKNTLATVQSLARHSLGRESRDGRRETFIERLLALSRAHDLLTRRVWENAELGEVIDQTLEPYRERAHAEGPDVWLSANAAVTLSMVFHELATNAAKYGALSHSGGVVEVAWRADDALQNLILTWTERNGPAVTAPAGAGFGSRLIAASLKTEFGGDATTTFLPGGLSCILRLPLSERVSLTPPTGKRAPIL